ncbi:MAG: heavy metal translocating P-type ATPase, partial [Gracilimonas sp.]
MNHQNHDHNEKHQHDHHDHENHSDHNNHEHGDHENHSHHEHHKQMVQDFKWRFWWVLGLTIPIMALSPMIQDFLGVDWRFTADIWILAALSTVVYFFGGWPFLSGLVDELNKKQPGMMTLIGLAISIAYLYSTAVVFGFDGDLLYWELSTLVGIMLLGHWIEMRSVMSASSALEELAALIPGEAHRVKEDGSTEDVSVEELQKGDKVLIKP